jgi:hypothetical protein
MLCAFGWLRQEHAREVVKWSRHPKHLQENAARYIQIRNHILASALTQEEAINFFREQA